MTIAHDRKQALERAVARLIRKNTDAFQVVAAALSGVRNGGTDRRLASQVFGFDPGRTEPLDVLVLESVLNGLEADDIEEIIRRYARRRGLQY